MMISKVTFQHLLCFLFLLCLSTEQFAQISVPNAAFTYSQDFSTLANSGTANTTVPTGWAFLEAGANGNTTYAAGTGSDNAGNTYSFGPTANTERSFGGLQSGNLTPTVGVCFTNNTGVAINALTIGYTGETWRVGTANRADGISFQYNQSTTSISGAGTWTSFAALDYFNPGQAAGSGTMQHSTTLSETIMGLNIAAGSTFCFRWNSSDATGADDGIGVDDFSLSAVTLASPCSSITTLTCGVPVSVNPSGAGVWNVEACGFTTPGQENVFSFTPTMTGMHTLQVNSTNDAYIDYFYKLASDGCSDTGWTCIDDISSADDVAFGPLTAGTQYYILLDPEGTGATPHNFQVNCAIVIPPTAPANDLCANAETIPAMDANICGTTLEANADNPNGGADCPDGGSADAEGFGVWYTFVGDGNTWTLLFPSEGEEWDPEVNVYSGSCGSLTCVTGDDDSGGGDFGLSALVTVNTMVGTVYYVYVHSASSEGGTHDFCFFVTIEGASEPFPENETEAVSCPASADEVPTPPTYTGPGCGTPVVPTGPVITNTPDPLTCEGTRVYAWTYVDCNGVTNVWTFTYTIEYNPFFVDQGDGAATVACPAAATLPSPPEVSDACDNGLTPTGPVITDSPNPITCEGTRTYTWTYTDCEGNSDTWSFVYTIERNPFAIAAADGSATVACPAAATAPTLPTVTSDCGETLTPTGPVITNTPDPITCEGTRTYVYTYTDCEGNTDTWSFVYTIERSTFTVPANGAATVACVAAATPPTLPTVTSNCGETITPTGPTITDSPNPLTCEGTRTYAYTYTDCEGNTLTWSFVYTIERQPFTLPANGAATVACPALATQPTPPVVASNCGETLTPTGPTITNAPNPIACEGTRTYAWVYTDCEGNTLTWSFVYTIERLPFTVPANGAATVACPALATQPVPPTVMSNCGETLTPTGPTITSVPSALTCEGTRTYAWVYTDCEGNTLTWSFVYTIERLPFLIATPPGSANVDCPDDTDVVPTPPVVLSNCGEVITPVVTASPKNDCEGDRVYTFTYTDCEGNTAAWLFTYHVEYLDFAVPPSEVLDVECPINATQPVPPTVFDNCGNLIVPVGPAVASSTNTSGCTGSRSYTWTYVDCSGNTHTWGRTYNFLYTADFIAPLDEENIVSCLAYAVAPFPQVRFDNCGLQIQVSAPVMTQSISPSGCSGWRTYSFVYTDCGGHSHPWNFTYFIEDNQAPLGTCPGASSSPVTVDVSDLGCIEEVPCPDDYDFEDKIQELLEAGNYFDVCYGDELFVTLDSYTDLWQCADPDGDGEFTFGRTFNFLIADRCGNEYANLCSVTYSGECQPMETFPQEAWGVEGGAPGNTLPTATPDLQVVTNLLSSGPVVVGGSTRSITLNDAQCVMNMLPGTGGPAVLANCHQTNCAGCNPMGIAGLKNVMAANAIALELNMRYNIVYNGLEREDLRDQSLACIYLHPCIFTCDGTSDNCELHFFDATGAEHSEPFTVGGLQDLVNIYLNGSLTMTIGQKVIYGTALNESLLNLNSYFGSTSNATACDGFTSGGDNGTAVEKLLLEYTLEANNATDNSDVNYELTPNPASNEVNFKLVDIAEGQEVSLEVFNPLGQRVLGRDFGKATYINERLDLGKLGSGLYLVSVKVGDQRFEQKLVISKN